MCKDLMAALDSSMLFHSGAESPADLEALAAAGLPIGVSMANLSRPMQDRVCQYLQTGARVFVDSGAFSAYQKQKEADFPRVFDRYFQMLLAAIGTGHLSFIMPDSIGKQERSLELQVQWQIVIQLFINAGCDAIIPIHPGKRPLSEVYRDLEAMFGKGTFRVGIPSNAEACPLDDFIELIENAPPSMLGLHFLGLGNRTNLLLERLNIIETYGRHLLMSHDAVRFRSMAGKEKPLTVWRQQIFDWILAHGPYDGLITPKAKDAVRSGIYKIVSYVSGVMQIIYIGFSLDWDGNPSTTPPVRYLRTFVTRYRNKKRVRISLAEACKASYLKKLGAYARKCALYALITNQNPWKTIGKVKMPQAGKNIGAAQLPADEPNPHQSGARYAAQVKRRKRQAQVDLAKAYLTATNRFFNDTIIAKMVGVSRETISRYYRLGSM